MDLYRRSARAHELSRRAQRTASTLIPRVPSEVGVVDLASQERRGLCQAPDTTSASRAQKVEDGTSSLFARKHTARKLEGLPFRAAIGDRQAVYWWLLGHELSFQAKSLGSRPRASNRAQTWHAQRSCYKAPPPRKKRGRRRAARGHTADFAQLLYHRFLVGHWCSRRLDDSGLVAHLCSVRTILWRT